MERCKVIARYAIGVDTIDVEAAAAKGIYVANVPDYCIGEVADTAIAHIMNAQRKITLANRLLLEKAFEMDKIRPVRRMENEVLCLIGFGHIARNVAAKMKAFFQEIDIILEPPGFCPVVSALATSYSKFFPNLLLSPMYPIVFVRLIFALTTCHLSCIN